MTTDTMIPATANEPIEQNTVVTPLIHTRFSRSLWWLLALLATYMVAAVLYAVGAGVYFASSQPELAHSEGAALLAEHLHTPNGITLMYLATAIPVLLLLLKAASLPPQHWQQTLAMRAVALKRYLPWLGAFVGYSLCTTIIDRFWPIEAGEFIESIKGVRHLGLFITMVLVAPVVEELVFRGYLFQAWRNSFLGLWGTLLATSALFTLIHAGQYPMIILAMLFSFSLLLGLAREKTGSVYVPMAMHAANNLLAFILINWLGYV